MCAKASEVAHAPRRHLHDLDSSLGGSRDDKAEPRIELAIRPGFAAGHHRGPHREAKVADRACEDPVEE